MKECQQTPPLPPTPATFLYSSRTQASLNPPQLASGHLRTQAVLS